MANQEYTPLSDATERKLYAATKKANAAIDAIEGFAKVKGDPEKCAAYARKNARKIVAAMFASKVLIQTLALALAGE